MQEALGELERQNRPLKSVEQARVALEEGTKRKQKGKSLIS